MNLAGIIELTAFSTPRVFLSGHLQPESLHRIRKKNHDRGCAEGP
jgi:hypothetical protein